MYRKVDQSYIDKIKSLYGVPSLVSMLQKALDKGINVEVIDNYEDKGVFRLSENNAEFYIFDTNSYSSMSAFSKVMTKDKYLAYLLMTSSSIPTPKTYLLKDIKLSNENKYVLKPRYGGKGRDISFFQGKDWEDRDFNEAMIIQDFHNGSDLRIQVVAGELFAACVREPANVIGDGVSSINELIDIKNKQKLPQNRIQINNESLDYLGRFNLDVDTILDLDEKVYLTELSNISLGGDIWDVTDKVHKSYFDLSKQLAKIFKERNFAIDCVTNDFSIDLLGSGAQVIELNSPNMWFHHLIAEPLGRDVGEAILDDWLKNAECY